MGLMDGIDTGLVNNVKAEQVGGSILPVGIYPAKINLAYLRKADSGAVMFHLETVSGENEINWTTCFKSGDEKGNKSTYTDKNGNDRLLPGVEQMINIFKVVGLDINSQNPVVKTIEYGKDKTPTEVKVFEELRTKEFTALCRHFTELNQDKNDTIIKFDIEKFADKDGKNSDGEDMIEKYSKVLEKTPLKPLAKKQKAILDAVNGVGAGATSGSTSGATGGGW